jgi:hypothetical protein
VANKQDQQVLPHLRKAIQHFHGPWVLTEQVERIKIKTRGAEWSMPHLPPPFAKPAQLIRISLRAIDGQQQARSSSIQPRKPINTGKNSLRIQNTRM